MKHLMLFLLLTTLTYSQSLWWTNNTTDSTVDTYVCIDSVLTDSSIINIDTTLTDNSLLSRTWENNVLGAVGTTVTGSSTIAVTGTNPISGTYSLLSTVVDSASGAYAWYKLPNAIAEGDSIWFRFRVKNVNLENGTEASNFKSFFWYGDSGADPGKLLRMDFRKTNNANTYYQVRTSNDNNTMLSTSISLDSTIAEGGNVEVIILFRGSSVEADNYLQYWVSNYNTGLMTHDGTSDPFTSTNGGADILGQYVRLGFSPVDVTTLNDGDAISFDNFYVASDSLGLYPSTSIDTTWGNYEYQCTDSTLQASIENLEKEIEKIEKDIEDLWKDWKIILYAENISNEGILGIKKER